MENTKPEHARTALIDAAANGASEDVLARLFLRDSKVKRICQEVLRRRFVSETLLDDVKISTWIVLSKWHTEGRIDNPDGLYSLIYLIALRAAKREGARKETELLFGADGMGDDGGVSEDEVLEKVDFSHDYDLASQYDSKAAKEKIVYIWNNRILGEKNAKQNDGTFRLE